MQHQPERVQIDAGSARLSALDYGGDGPPLVLLHGAADLAWSMDSVAQRFADRFRVVAPDLRGHGHSEHPGAYSLLHYAADLRSVIRHFSLVRPVVIAHSLGGHVAAHYGGLCPDGVAGLALIEGLGPPAERPARSDAARAAMALLHLDLLSTRLAHRPLRDIDEATARLVATHPRLDPQRARFLAEHGTRPGPDGGLTWRFDPRSRDWITSIDHEATEQLWRNVTCPVLVVTGVESWDTWWNARLRSLPEGESRTRLAPAQWQARLNLFPDVEEVEVAEAGHMVQFDQPERLNDILEDFLSRRLGL